MGLPKILVYESRGKKMGCYDCHFYRKGFDHDMGCEYNACEYWGYEYFCPGSCDAYSRYGEIPLEKQYKIYVDTDGEFGTEPPDMLRIEDFKNFVDETVMATRHSANNDLIQLFLVFEPYEENCSYIVRVTNEKGKQDNKTYYLDEAINLYNKCCR